MKRLLLTAFTIAALAMPLASSAQSPTPGTSLEPGPLGVDTMGVCLSISGPVTLLTAESLTQGIIDGTFVIEGLSTDCESPEESGSPAPTTAP